MARFAEKRPDHAVTAFGVGHNGIDGLGSSRKEALGATSHLGAGAEPKKVMMFNHGCRADRVPGFRQKLELRLGNYVIVARSIPKP